MALISLASALVPVISQACVIMLPNCETPEGQANLYDAVGTAVVFHEVFGTPAQQRQRVVLAECTSRSAVMVEADEAGIEAFWAAETYMTEVLRDDAPQTIAQVTRYLRNLGVDAVRVTLGAQHCGCDLPDMQVTETYCPDF